MTRRSVKIGAGAAVLLSGVGVAAVVNAPLASAALSDCGSGNWCYWASSGWNPNPPGQWAGSAQNYDQSGWANLNVGYYNHGTTGTPVNFYAGRNYGGTWFGAVSPGYGHDNPGAPIYKNAESHRWCFC